MSEHHTAYLAGLQLADSALPIGRFVHSYGLESWVTSHGELDEEDLAGLVATCVRDVLAPLDGAVVAHAWRATELVDLLSLDTVTTAHKLGAPAREASQSCGRRLAALAGELTSDALVAKLTGEVRARRTEGNLAVVAGALSRALGLDVADAVLVELRGAATGLLSAAVRLGRLSPTRAQVLLAAAAPALAEAAEESLRLPLDELRSTGPGLEIAGLAHRRLDGRTFAT